MKRRELFPLVAGLAGVASLGISPLAHSRTVPGQVRKGYVDGPWGQVHYYTLGEGIPLLLSHQSPLSGRQFERALPFLANRAIQAIAVDTPGYGNSHAPPGPPRLEDYADAYEAVITGLGLESAWCLGHHTGAGILCHLAATRPNRVRGLILNGTPWFTETERRDYQTRELAPPAIEKDGSHLQARWDRRARYSPGWTDEVAMHRRLVDQLWAGDTVWYGHHAAFRYDMEPDLLAVQVPTMILTNTGDGLYETSKAAHDLRPDFAFHALQGGTHDIVDEQPEAWAKAVADFVLQPR